MSNLRQMGVAAQVYAAENDNTTVAATQRILPPDTRFLWHWTLATYLNVGPNFSGPYLFNATNVKSGYNQPPDRIPSSLHIFICPSQTARFIYGAEIQYGINFRNVSSPDGEPTFKEWVRFDDVNAKKPLSNMLLFGDAATSIEPLKSVDGTPYAMGPWGQHINPAPVASSASFGDRHQGATGNALFMDSHGESRKWRDMARLPGDPELPAIRAKYWNYNGSF